MACLSLEETTQVSSGLWNVSTVNTVPFTDRLCAHETTVATEQPLLASSKCQGSVTHTVLSQLPQVSTVNTQSIRQGCMLSSLIINAMNFAKEISSMAGALRRRVNTMLIQITAKKVL